MRERLDLVSSAPKQWHTRSWCAIPFIRSFASTRMYCTMSVRLAAFSSTLPPSLPPMSSVLKLFGSASTVCFLCSFLTLSTDLIFFSCSSERCPARTAPSLQSGQMELNQTDSRQLLPWDLLIVSGILCEPLRAEYLLTGLARMLFWSELR